MSCGRRVGIVIVNYNSSSHLERLLASLANEPETSILVWDNFSTEYELDELARLELRHPGVAFHRCATNLGFGAGVNKAVERLTAEGDVDYIWILNPDITVMPGALGALLDSAIRNRCSIISPLILAAGAGKIWYSGGRIEARQGRSVHDGIGKHVNSWASSYEEVTFVTGAAPLISRAAWRLLGGFDERFFLYCEDAELSMRAADAGIRQGVERSAIVHHAEGGSSSTRGEGPGESFYYYVQRNRLLLYGPLSSRLRVLLGPGLVETIRLTLLPWRPLDRGSPGRFMASLHGLLDGLRNAEGQRPQGGRQ